MASGERASAAVRAIVAILAFHAATGVAPAAGTPAAGTVTNAVSGTGTNVAVEVMADRFEYAYVRNIIKAYGHVVVRRGSETLNADRVTVRTDTQEVWASGNATLRRGKETWAGSRLYCNMKTGRVSGEDESKLFSEPFHITVDGGFERASDKEVVAWDATLTTCNLDRPDAHYYMHASKIWFVPGEEIQAEQVVFYLGGVPVMYLPYLKQTSDGCGVSVRPGYSSTMGAFLLTGYEYALDDDWWGKTHLDYRSKRGVGVGQDFMLRGRDGLGGGELNLYYIGDKRPMDDDDVATGQTIDKERYRVRLSENINFDRRTYALSQLNYLSDPDMLEDFFRSEYRNSSTPENYVTLTHRGDNYVADLTIRGRLNDFYEAVNRAPEASLTLSPQQIGGSPLYYEGRTAGGYLEHVWPESQKTDPYSCGRFDSRHLFSVPTQVDFISVTPRAGYRGTYYSATHADATGGTPAGTNADGTASGVTNAVHAAEESAGLRSLVELGLASSFKAFSVWKRPEGDSIGLRHTVEPYINYTFMPEPNLRPARLYQFDDVDALDRRNDIRVGLRNTLQAKRGGQAWRLLDLNTYADVKLDPEENEHAVDFWVTEAQLRPLDGIALDFDTKFPVRPDVPTEINTHLVVGDTNRFGADIEYRFREDSNRLISGSLTFSPVRMWTIGYYARYDFEASRLEEHNLWIRRTYDCMGLSLGFSQIPGYTRSDGIEQKDEYQVGFRLWLTAFPDRALSIN